MTKIAVFPGSFDPVTKGHQNLILRAIPLFDELIVAIGYNSLKSSYFPVEKREQWLRELFVNEPKVKVSCYEGLTVDFCRKAGADYIIRGLRSSADFEFEKTIAQVNKAMAPAVETVFILSDPAFSSISSSIVREILKNGGDPGNFVPVDLSK